MLDSAVHGISVSILIAVAVSVLIRARTRWDLRNSDDNRLNSYSGLFDEEFSAMMTSDPSNDITLVATEVDSYCLGLFHRTLEIHTQSMTASLEVRNCEMARRGVGIAMAINRDGKTFGRCRTDGETTIGRLRAVVSMVGVVMVAARLCHCTEGKTKQNCNKNVFLHCILYFV